MSVALAHQQVESAEGSGARHQASEIRVMLRAALVERLLHGMEDVQDRLARFLKNPGRLGAVNLNLVLSESSITYEVWKEPSTVPERRARMAQTLGLSAGVEDAALLRALMAEVHQAFVDFQASAPGREAFQRYDALLATCEKANILPIVPAHDTGPMLDELARVGIPHERDFTRSLLVDPRLVLVGLSYEAGSSTHTVIAGQSVSELGALVAHVRSLNPRLTNHQVRKLLVRASMDGTSLTPKSLGQAEVERVKEFTRQLLRLQVVELLFV
jgi:hypothetical protein